MNRMPVFDHASFNEHCFKTSIITIFLPEARADISSDLGSSTPDIAFENTTSKLKFWLSLRNEANLNVMPRSWREVASYIVVNCNWLNLHLIPTFFANYKRVL